jgi:hypothetical protein
MSENPLDLSKINESTIPRVDNKAIQEEKYFISGIIRKNRIEGSIHWCKVLFLWICFLIVAGAIFCRVIILLLPDRLKWLTDAQIDKIDEFFIHGTIGAVVIGYLNRTIKNITEE